jgi:hypothetical protein
MQQKLVVQKHTHVLQTDSLSCDGLVMDTDWTMPLTPLLVQPTRYGRAGTDLPDTEQSVDVTFVPMMVSAVTKPLPRRWDSGGAPAAAAAAMHIATVRLSTFPPLPATHGIATRLYFLLSRRIQKCCMLVFWSGKRLFPSLKCLENAQHQLLGSLLAPVSHPSVFRSARSDSDRRPAATGNCQHCQSTNYGLIKNYQELSKYFIRFSTGFLYCPFFPISILKL